MTQPAESPGEAAVSRARTGYIFACVLLLFLPMMARRTGYRFDLLIRSEHRAAFRVAEVALMVAVLLGLFALARRICRTRADALGGAAATPDAVANDFVKLKRIVLVGFGILAFMGWLIVLADGWSAVNALLLILPIMLLLATMPTEGGLQAFADKINAARGPTLSDDS